jgi:hypothetical protein
MLYVNIEQMINQIKFKSASMKKDVKSHFQQYFSYNVAVSFIGGGPGENQRRVESH